MFGFNKIKKNKVGVVIDFAGSSVGAVLIEIGEDEKTRALISFRKSFNFLFNTDFSASLRCAKDSLRFVIKELKKNHPGKIDFVVCVLSSPWFVSQTKTITATMEKPFEIKNDFFNDLIKEEEKSFNKNEKINSQFIEHEITKTELNGYDVKNPIGKNANSVKLSVYLSAGAKKAMEMAREEIENVFGNVDLSFATFPLVAFKVLNDIMKAKEGFLIIDIGGEITEIILARAGALERTVSFSCGYNLILRKISLRTNAFFEEAPSLLNAYSRGHLSADNVDKVALAIEESVKEWQDGFKKSLGEISEETLFPQNVFLIGDDFVCKPFYLCVNNDDFSEFTVLRKPFIAKKIEHSWLKQYFDVAESFKYENGLNLEIESVYVGDFLKKLKIKN